MYKRFENAIQLDKNQKIKLLNDYNEYYEDLIKTTQGFDKLNIKIPREEFDDILDKVGSLLIEKAIEMAKSGAVKDFLDNNPLPASMKNMLPDDFRAFCLILNSLKQWVSAESASTDRYLLGGTARDTIREITKKCIITDETLEKDAELHHPLRDGRPPIYISKKGHNILEYGVSDNNDSIWEKMKTLKKEKHGSWKLLREGCESIINKSDSRANGKAFSNTIIRETGLNAKEIIQLLDSKNI